MRSGPLFVLGIALVLFTAVSPLYANDESQPETSEPVETAPSPESGAAAEVASELPSAEPMEVAEADTAEAIPADGSEGEAVISEQEAIEPEAVTAVAVETQGVELEAVVTLDGRIGDYGMGMSELMYSSSQV